MFTHILKYSIYGTCPARALSTPVGGYFPTNSLCSTVRKYTSILVTPYPQLLYTCTVFTKHWCVAAHYGYQFISYLLETQRGEVYYRSINIKSNTQLSQIKQLPNLIHTMKDFPIACCSKDTTRAPSSW